MIVLFEFALFDAEDELLLLLMDGPFFLDLRCSSKSSSSSSSTTFTAAISTSSLLFRTGGGGSF